MKKLLLLTILFLGCSRDPRDLPTTWMPDPTLSVDTREVSSESVVFLGNSLTHIAVWQDIFPDIQTANQGIGGNTSIQVLDRLNSITKRKPKKVFLLIGANDFIMGYPHPLITGTQRKIVSTIRTQSPGTEIYVQSIFPFGKDADLYYPSVPRSYKEDIRSLNKALKIMCQLENVTYIDVHSHLKDHKGYLKSIFTDDKIHLTKKGYDKWSSVIRKYVH